MRSSVIASHFRKARKTSSRKISSSTEKSTSSGIGWKIPSRVKTPREQTAWQCG